MERLDVTATRVLASLLDGQPMSDGKLAFAWRIAAGPTLARAASVSWSPDGTVYVRARTRAWRDEIVRARPTILQRVQHLLGSDHVRRLSILGDD